MKTEDELDAEIAKLFDEVTTTKVEMVNGKPRISDQATLDQMEREEAARRMEEACGLFLTVNENFRRIAQHPRVVTDPQMNALWWDRLEAVYVAEKAVLEALRRAAADHGGQQTLGEIPKALAGRQQAES